MDTTTISIITGVLGSLVGASTTIAIAWITQKTLNRRELIRAEADKREILYGEFIGECSSLIIDAFGHTLEGPEKMLSAYGLVNRIRVSASDAVLAEAEHIVKWITEQYFSPNLLLEEMRVIAQSPETDPLKRFAAACRAELKSIRAGV
jgi:hypothetical protein